MNLIMFQNINQKNDFMSVFSIIARIKAKKISLPVPVLFQI